MEQGGQEEALGPQPALGVRQVEHHRLLAGEEDKEVAHPGEEGIVAPFKAQVELAGDGGAGGGRGLGYLVQGEHPVAQHLGGLFVPEGEFALHQNGHVDLEVAAALLQRPGEGHAASREPVSSSRVT